MYTTRGKATERLTHSEELKWVISWVPSLILMSWMLKSDDPMSGIQRPSPCMKSRARYSGKSARHGHRMTWSKNHGIIKKNPMARATTTTAMRSKTLRRA